MAEEPTKKSARRTQQIGKYEILGHIATGGMGVIYKAHDVDLDRLVALKVLPADLAAQQTTLIRFQREAKAAAQLRHENIVSIFDVGESRGTYYIAFEFIEGVNLHDFIERKSKLDPEEARQILMQASHALAHAHEKGIVHRDIKPSNFLLTIKEKELIVKLTDFGLAIRYENDAEFRITRDKTTVGTVDYMSPEQARDSRAVDTRSDIYSLGCTFFHMLSGVAPFGKGTLPERIVHHMQSPPPDLRRLNKKVPDHLVHIAARMLAKRPDDRYQTVAELLFDLENPDKVSAPVKRTPMLNKVKREQSAKEEPTPTELDKKTRPEQRAEQIQVPPKRSSRAVTEEIAAEPATDDSVEQDIVVEVVEPKPPKAPLPQKKASRSSPIWLYATGASMGVLGVVLALALICGGGRTPKKDPDPAPKKAETPDSPQEKPVVVELPKEDVIDTSPALMTVVMPALPAIEAAEKVDRTALLKEMYESFTTFPEAPADAAVFHVSRLATTGPHTFCLLADACAAAQANAATVIQIDDNGPIFVQNMPMLEKRTIHMRAGPGIRPLLVWDDPPSVAAMCQLRAGSLIVENLDFVARRTGDGAAALFDLPGSDFHARACTFSIAGKAPSGVALVRRHQESSPKVPQTWLQDCFVRGPDMILLDLNGAAATLLVEDSLVVGHRQPLLQIRDANAMTLRCVRSTLVSGQIALRCQSTMSKTESPTIHGFLLDSIMSRDDVSASWGDLIQLVNSNAYKMRWRGVNSVYAGWKNLLVSDNKAIAGNDIDGWRRQWSAASGERAQAETWPTSPPSSVDNLPASALWPGRSAVSFGAISEVGAIGCTIGRLPPAPSAWMGRAFEPGTAPIVPSVAAAPTIAASKDGLYHGERLDLTKVDLGIHLTRELQKRKPASRVVMHLTGRGVCQTSPVQIKGVPSLVLNFEPGKDFTLEANPTSAVERSPLIDIMGGHLEVIGAHIRLSNITLLPAIAQVRDGNLTLQRCRLEGPLLSNNFSHLLAASNSRAAATTVLLRDNILIASKLLHLQGNLQLQARNNVLVALEDGIHFELHQPTAALTHIFDHNTFAAKRDFFAVHLGPEFQPTGSARFFANSNAFLQPFSEVRREGMLLRGAEAWAASGRWNWQGRYNIYDKRLPTWFGSKHKLSDWQATWGQAGERNAVLLEAGKTFDADIVTQAAMWQQLERLALPAELRGDLNTGPPGADLVGLGITKK